MTTTIIAPYTINAIAWNINHEQASMVPSLVLQAVIDGPDGKTIPVPKIPTHPDPKYPWPFFTSRCLYGAE